MILVLFVETLALVILFIDFQLTQCKKQFGCEYFQMDESDIKPYYILKLR